ncbi:MULTISPECIES: AAA family ATPase [unclassified Microcoleus]|uniref:AAA family ATPase n=1 Tax=unclassified Microcoleus TaxID=2642155 RepID=UPI002FCEF781
MIELTGYQIIAGIYSGTRTLVYRGTRLSDQKPVAIKVLRNEYPSFSELLHFRNQYTIAKNLNLPGIIQTYSLEPYRNGYALIVEDFGGISLKEWTGKGKTVQSLVYFFQIAIDLSNTLDILYRHRIIHKDIKPANILINPETKQVKLIDFSIASLLPRETQTLMSPNVLEGTLSYLSPEQTGRMNRGVDYRTDFYSLGVTFYELLTGELPFQSNDPMELVHSHIAKQPPLLGEKKRGEIPQVLCDIVMKLMAKNAEDRYQSALGLKFDLEFCWRQLEESGKIKSFAIARRDVCDRFIIPEKLYGRETEVAQLLAAFDRISGSETLPGNEGKRELMLVAGFSGIGKTAIVNEVHKPIVRQRGYFIKGKFDQFNRNIPFSAFVQAFRELMGQLLSESEAQLAAWKTKILAALGDSAQVIIEVIPELEQIISQQPPATELSGTAAQNRFNLLFQKFLQVFTTKQHPLVIFLDDLQWADSASLKLMQLLMSESDGRYLLLIGAYRDNEVSAAHPLMLALEEIGKAQAAIKTIRLAALTETSLNQLVADTLSCSPEIGQPLTQLIYQKTKGNPFFSVQFLKMLHDEGLIQFDLDGGNWHCDLAKVKALAVTDDIVDFMALQLQKLPPATQNVLKLAACIGNQFDLDTLAVVSEQLATETAADLWQALQEELILPESEVYKFYLGLEKQDRAQNSEVVNYKFLHDRVQQAAYSLIPEDQKQSVHLHIGQLLWDRTSAEQLDEKIFAIVSQFNLGIDRIAIQAQRDHLANLNLMAARKARLSAAYPASAQYCDIGLQLLATDSSDEWMRQPILTSELHIEAANSACLIGAFERVNVCVEAVLEHTANPLEQVKALEIKIQSLIARNQLSEAIQVARAILQELDVELPEHPTQDMVAPALNTIRDRLMSVDVMNSPRMSDPQKLAAMNILSSMASAAYMGSPALYPLIVLKQIELSLQFGNAIQTPYAYSTYGLILCAFGGEIVAGNRAADIAIALMEMLKASSFKAKIINLVYPFVRIWQEPIHTVLMPLLEGYQAGLETGDLEFAAYCVHNRCELAYAAGNELLQLGQEKEIYAEAIAQLKQTTALNFHQIHQQAVLNWIGETDEPQKLVGAAYDETTRLPQHQSAGDTYSIGSVYAHKLILAYHFGQPQEALEMAQIAETTIGAIIGTVFYGVFYFYHALTLLANTNTLPISEAVTKDLEQLTNWATHAPMNFAHKCDLIRAEQQRVLGHKAEAIDLYDRAISLAKENQFLNEEALANELAAKFYLKWGKEKVAAAYMQEAYYCYARWGAKAKTDDLEKRYPDLLRPILQQSAQPITILETLSTLTNPTYSIHSGTHHTTSSTSINHALDFTTLLQISQVISSTIDLNELLQILTQTMLQNSGADRCALMLCQDQQWQVRAIATWENISLQREPLENNPTVPVKLIQYVKNTLAAVVIDHIKTDLPVIDDYLEHHQPESLLGLPILNQGNLVGILYLENRITSGVFSHDRLLVLNFLSSQAAIALENAGLYHQVQQTLNELQQTQMQMIQSEKMSALGNLVAGVAHEINNPVGFIAGNINEAHAGVQDLIDYLRLYQEKFPPSEAELINKAEEIDLDYLAEDLPKMLSSMKIGCERIKNISTSLRTFSRADTAHKVEANIHEGLDSTLMILRHRLKANDKHPEIQIIKKYGNIPKVKCYLGQLNQVFMNLLANAIDALEESNQGRSFAAIQAHPNHITIRTKVEGEKVKISIADNGKGMSEQVKNRIFDHLFTTKDVGKGTGLGLAIARQIVEEKHGGKLSCFSTPGEGTEFVIEILID